MSNSSLVNYTNLSPNCNKPRNSKIQKITIHHTAGIASVEGLGNLFIKNESSANYGIGSDGRVGMYVEESNRAWTSSNRDNDMQAITIEVSNDGGAPDWHVSDKVMNKLIDLCVDICKRNNIDKLNYTGTKDGNLTMHSMFANTECPGPYLKSKFSEIAKRVNEKLNSTTQKEYVVKSGDTLYTIANAHNTTIKVIALANNIKNINLINVGQKLIIPSATSAPTITNSDKILKVGGYVKIKQGAKDIWTNKCFSSFVYNKTYRIIKISGKNVTFGINNQPTGTTHSENIIIL